jgi:hypothetical protein
MDSPFERETQIAVSQYPSAEGAAVDAPIVVEDSDTENAGDGGRSRTTGTVETVNHGVRIEYRNVAFSENACDGGFTAGKPASETHDARPFCRGRLIVPFGRFRIPNSEFRTHSAGSSSHSV